MRAFKRLACSCRPCRCSCWPRPGPCQAPAAKEVPRFFGVFTPTVGAWSEYAVVETEGGKKSTMRNAIVAPRATASGTRSPSPTPVCATSSDVPQGDPTSRRTSSA